MTIKPVDPNKADEALEFVRNGGRLVVRTALRTIIIDQKTVRAFDKAAQWLLKAEGDGYRLKSGKRSFYLLPGQLEVVIEE